MLHRADSSLKGQFYERFKKMKERTHTQLSLTVITIEAKGQSFGPDRHLVQLIRGQKPGGGGGLMESAVAGAAMPAQLYNRHTL